MARKKASLKLQKFKKLYLEGATATEAAWQVYNCKNRRVAGEIGHQNLKRLDFATLLEEAGITDKRLIDKVSDGLDAKKVISSYGGKNADASTTDFIEVPDHPTQHKYLETALKLKGRGQANATNSIQVNVQPIMQINPKVEEGKDD